MLQYARSLKNSMQLWSAETELWNFAARPEAFRIHFDAKATCLETFQ